MNDYQNLYKMCLSQIMAVDTLIKLIDISNKTGGSLSIDTVSALCAEQIEQRVITDHFTVIVEAIRKYKEAGES